MLDQVLNKEMIQIVDHVDSWEDAVKLAAQPLIDYQYITDGYVDDMIQNIHELGPYIVIAPGIAIAHARPNENVSKVGLSLLKLDHGINFAKDSHYASLVFVLAAIDNKQHLGVLAELANVLNNPDKVDELTRCKSQMEIMDIMHHQ